MTPATEFDALMADFEAAQTALDDTPGEGADQRYHRAFSAMRNARPTDPPSLARQLRWWLEQIGADDEDEPMLRHIAGQLEKGG